MTEPKAHRRSLPAAVRCVFDVWFAAYPAWCWLLAFLQWTRVPEYREPIVDATVWAELIAVTAALATTLWCLWSLDKKMKGMEKAKWYFIVLVAFPFGPTLCYFTRLRPVQRIQQLLTEYPH